MEASDHLEWPLASVACLAPDAAESLPNFLIISPPKTGSTWLASNLRCHPEIFVPEVKETKYFSSYHKWLDLNWYAGHFKEGEERLKGEASPSYAILPRRMIGLVRALLPRVKLIYLMRDPVARAWSHARHNHRYQEANFEGYTGDLHNVPDDRWHENFRHPWPVASGDYLGQLQRWTSVFPQEQMFVDQYERIEADPEGLLSKIFEFLGVRQDVDWSTFRTEEKILPGPSKMLSRCLASDLRHLLEKRTRELSTFLDERFDLCVDDHWTETLGDFRWERLAGCEAVAQTDGTMAPFSPIPATCIPGNHPVSCGSKAPWGATDEEGLHVAPGPCLFEPAIDDDLLDKLLETIDCPHPRVIVERFHEFDIVLHRGRFIALAHTSESVDLKCLKEADLGARGDVLVADSLEGAKERITRHVIGELQQEQMASRAAEQDLRYQIAECRELVSDARRSLLAEHQELARQLADHHTFVSRVRNSFVFRLRRRLALLITKKNCPP